MTRRLANGLGGFGGLILLAQLDSKRCCTSRKGCLDARNVRFERGVIGRWLDVASRASPVRESPAPRHSFKLFSAAMTAISPALVSRTGSSTKRSTSGTPEVT